MKNATGNKSRISRAKWKLPSRELVAKTNGPLSDLLKSEEWVSSTARLPLALGQEPNGRWVIPDLTQFRHMLIAGFRPFIADGIHAILGGLLSARTPDDMRLILMDTAKTGLSRYGKLPHLLAPVLKKPKQANLALLWAICEFGRRTEMLRQAGVSDIGAFNEAGKNPIMNKIRKHPPGGLPRIIIVADDMWLHKGGADAFRKKCAALAACAHRTGIHLIAMTTNPGESLTDGLQSSLRGRVAFSLLNAGDSQLVIGRSGAEKLERMNEMLIGLKARRFVRAQCAHVVPTEIGKIVRFWENQGKPDFLPEFRRKARWIQ